MKISMNAVAPSATREHDDRVHQRALHLALERVGLFDVGRETHEDLVEHTARFAGSDHVAEQVVEHVRCLPSASDSVEPASTSRVTSPITRPNDGLLDCLARMSRHCTSGRPAEIMVANWRVKIARSLVRHAGAADLRQREAADFGVIEVIRIFFLRSGVDRLFLAPDLDFARLGSPRRAYDPSRQRLALDPPTPRCG